MSLSQFKIDYPHLKKASEIEQTTQAPLTRCTPLNRFLEDSIHHGQVSEWGMPWGHMTRYLLLLFLAEATQSGQWCLWLHKREDLNIFAPSWLSFGVDLTKFRSTHFDGTLDGFRPVFMEPFFKIIIIDSQIHKKELPFLAKRARLQKQLIFVIHDNHLSGRYANPWAKTRFNSWYDSIEQRFYLRPIKGLSSRQLSLRAEDIW